MQEAAARGIENGRKKVAMVIPLPGGLSGEAVGAWVAGKREKSKLKGAPAGAHIPCEK